MRQGCRRVATAPKMPLIRHRIVEVRRKYRPAGERPTLSNGFFRPVSLQQCWSTLISVGADASMLRSALPSHGGSDIVPREAVRLQGFPDGYVSRDPLAGEPMSFATSTGTGRWRTWRRRWRDLLLRIWERACACSQGAVRSGSRRKRLSERPVLVLERNL